jgi:glycosidase
VACHLVSIQPNHHQLPKLWLLLAALVLVSPAAVAQTTNNLWRAQSIYQIITDRFYDGNANNDNAEGTYAPGNPTGVHGGDFQGIEQKLDYLKSLGVTAIWISPIVLNTEGQFHGYSAWNFYEVAPHWGSISNLQHMVQAAHARGLRVIDDIVVNHAGDLVTGSGSGYPDFNYPTGYTLSYVSNSKTYPAPFNLTTSNPSLTNLFHDFGDIDNYNISNQTVLGWLSGLNDFRTETTYVRSNMAAIYEYWINQIGFDAFRVDSALEVDMGCWQTFCPAIHAYAGTNGNTNFFMFGEVDNGADATVAPYTGTEDGGPFEFDSVVDYPLYYIINSVFATASGNTAQIEYHYDDVLADYDPVSQMQLVTFLDNHDNPRFLSTSESNDNTNALAVALAFLYTARGIPCLYYGTEQGFDGTTDPNDREDMFAGEFKDGPAGTVLQLSSPGVDNFNMTHALFQWVARLNNFRRLYPALSLGTHVNQWNNPDGPGLFAYSRVLGTQEVFVVFNTATTSQTLPPRTLTYSAGTVLLNLLNTNQTITVATGSQSPNITVPAMTAEIFLAKSQWLPLDPVVISNSPAHATTNISPLSPIVLQFSKPMNTNSVQAAFSTVPPVTGTFAWSASQDTVTFTPAEPGFAPLTNITVVVTNTAADAVSSNHLVAAYSLLFATSAAPPSTYISSPSANGTVITLGTNTTYLLQICFTSALNTSGTDFFEISINGMNQPQSVYIFRPANSVSGCPGLASLFYNWSSASPGTVTGTNVIQVEYSNPNTGVVLSDVRSVIVPPPLAITGLTGYQSVVWSSTPGVSYTVLATTNLSQPFIPLSGVIPATGLSTSFLDVSNTPPAPQKFYEIEVAP